MWPKAKDEFNPSRKVAIVAYRNLPKVEWNEKRRKECIKNCKNDGITNWMKRVSFQQICDDTESMELKENIPDVIWSTRCFISSATLLPFH